MGFWAVDHQNLKRLPRPIDPDDILRIDVAGKPFSITAQALADWLNANRGDGGGFSPFTWSPDSVTADGLSQGAILIRDTPGLTGLTLLPTKLNQGVMIGNQSTLLSVSAPNMTEALADLEYWFYGGLAIENNALLEAALFPSCAEVSILSVTDNPSLTTLDLSALTSMSGRFNCLNNPSLTTLDLSALTTLSGGFYIYNNPSLTTLDLSALTLCQVMSCSSCAFAAPTVNSILAMLVAATSDGSAPWANTVDLAGGTSAAPTGQGIIDAATLVGRGATVTTN